MKNLSVILFSCLFVLACTEQDSKQHIITTDIDNFWNAYDQINATNDTLKQAELLDELFLSKGTPGLKAIMQARRYTPQEYLHAIRNYPLFWESIRDNTLKAQTFAGEIGVGIDRLKTLYPGLEPAQIFFTVGVFRTGGTILDGKVLIGSEIAMADEHTNTTEFPNSLGHLPSYFKTNPIKEMTFLNVHEFVHTQQVTTIGDNLLMQCLYEGVAEFVTVKALDIPSPTPAIAYGKQHDAQIKESFAKEMFSLSYHNWLWNDLDNAFEMRDLGYYVGYTIAEKYYEAAANKNEAIATLMELDYQDRENIEAIVDQTGYFSSSVSDLRAAFEASRPTILGIKPFENGAQAVLPGRTIVEVEFSAPMDQETRGFELGPLGEDHIMAVQSFTGFSTDGRIASFEVELEAGKRYQLVLSDRFRNENSIPISPYLIDIRTRK